jgi:erythromycin esterase
MTNLRSWRKRCLVLIALSCLATMPARGEADPAVPVADAHARITTLPPGDPAEWSDADLAWLDVWSDTPILAFGEATHGTHEFAAARLRMLRYLVERHGYRVLAMEAHFTESLFLDLCLDDPDCDLATTMRERMLVWTTQTTEMLATLSWLREYNARVVVSERVHFVGLDAQILDHTEDLLHLLLGDLDTVHGTAVEGAFMPLSELTRGDYEVMDAEDLTGHLSRLEELRTRLEAAIPDRRTSSLVDQVISVSTQSLEFLQAYFHDGILVRDRHLQENVAWARSLGDPGAKMVLWAHNAHVAVHRGYAEDAGGNMGWHLRQRYGEDYRAIGLTFVRGGFRAKVFDADGRVTVSPHDIVFVVDPREGSLNTLLAAVDEPRFVLRLDDLDPSGALARWLAQPRAVLGIGDLFLGFEKIDTYHYGGDRVMTPITAFDAIIHLDGTHPTVALPAAD